LPVLVIHDDDETALAELLDRLLDRGERTLGAHPNHFLMEAIRLLSDGGRLPFGTRRLGRPNTYLAAAAVLGHKIRDPTQDCRVCPRTAPIRQASPSFFTMTRAGG